MGRGEGTLGRLGKGSGAPGGAAAAGAGNVATADDALKQKVKTMEEIDEQRKLARAAERELKVRECFLFKIETRDPTPPDGTALEGERGRRLIRSPPARLPPIPAP